MPIRIINRIREIWNIRIRIPDRNTVIKALLTPCFYLITLAIIEILWPLMIPYLLLSGEISDFARYMRTFSGMMPHITQSTVRRNIKNYIIKSGWCKIVPCLIMAYYQWYIMATIYMATTFSGVCIIFISFSYYISWTTEGNNPEPTVSNVVVYIERGTIDSIRLEEWSDGDEAIMLNGDQRHLIHPGDLARLNGIHPSTRAPIIRTDNVIVRISSDSDESIGSTDLSSDESESISEELNNDTPETDEVESS